MLPCTEIACVESNDDVVWIHTRSDESYRTRISKWESLLDDRFLRIHRSYIVNTRFTVRPTASTVCIEGHTIEISRKYRPAADQRLPFRRANRTE